MAGYLGTYACSYHIQHHPLEAENRSRRGCQSAHFPQGGQKSSTAVVMRNSGRGEQTLLNFLLRPRLYFSASRNVLLGSQSLQAIPIGWYQLVQYMNPHAAASHIG